MRCLLHVVDCFVGKLIDLMHQWWLTILLLLDCRLHVVWVKRTVFELGSLWSALLSAHVTHFDVLFRSIGGCGMIVFLLELRVGCVRVGRRCVVLSGHIFLLVDVGTGIVFEEWIFIRSHKYIYKFQMVCIIYYRFAADNTCPLWLSAFVFI